MPRKSCDPPKKGGNPAPSTGFPRLPFQKMVNSGCSEKGGQRNAGFIQTGLLESTRVTMLSPDVISPNPDQPRRYFDPDGLYELAESIRVHGILQPLSVRRKGGGRYELIAGERRARAAMICGLEQVPCLVLEVSRESSCLLSLIENLQRRDLDFWEEAKALERLTTVYGLSQEEAAAKVGKSQSAVANKLRLLCACPRRCWPCSGSMASPSAMPGPFSACPPPRPRPPGADLLVKEGVDGGPHGEVCGGGPPQPDQGKKDPPSPADPGRPVLPQQPGPQLGGDALGRGGGPMPAEGGGEDLLLTIRIPKAKGQSPSGSGPA